jgi:hypothetical protein
MVPIFGAFQKVLSVLVADRRQAGPKRHSIESETSGVVRPGKGNLWAGLSFKETIDRHGGRLLVRAGKRSDQEPVAFRSDRFILAGHFLRFPPEASFQTKSEQRLH